MAETPPILARLRSGELTLLVESGGAPTFMSDRPGFAPLRGLLFEHPTLLDGADVAMPAAGLAAAYVLVHSKVGRVFVQHLTQEARKAFEEEGIEHHAASVAKKLPEEAAAVHEPLDARAREAVTPLALVEELRRIP